MAADDPVEEWQRLNTLYSEMGDTELLELKSQLGDLTEVAQGVLRDEMKRRNLWDLPAEEEKETPRAASAQQEVLFDDLRLGGVTVGEYDTLKEANLAVYVLELAGVQAAAGDGRGSFDLGLPFVRVGPLDAEKAASILAQPIAPQVRADFEEMQNLPDFEVPACPHCSSMEVMLEAFEPSNHWRCAECGHGWEDAVPEDAEVPEPNH